MKARTDCKSKTEMRTEQTSRSTSKRHLYNKHECWQLYESFEIGLLF